MFNLLDTVALTRDIPSAGLRRGDPGAMVEIHAPEAFEIEFVAASGHTHALVTLGVEHVRHIGGRDLIVFRDASA